MKTLVLAQESETPRERRNVRAWGDLLWRVGADEQSELGLSRLFQLSNTRDRGFVLPA